MSKNSKVGEEKSNVIMFPTSRIVNPSKTALHSDKVPKTLEEIKDVTQLIKAHKINQIMEIIVPLIAQGLLAHGINILQVKNENDVKHCAFMIEAIRSFIYKHFDLNHPIQTLADNVFDMQDGNISFHKVKVKETEANSNINNANT